jgi:hypothetical protein
MSVIFNRIWRHLKGVNRSGMVRLSGSVIVGSSGAVTSSDSPGFTITKQSAAGRYRIQLVDQDGTTAAEPAYVYDSDGSTLIAPFGFQDFNCTVVSYVADSAMTTSSGIHWAIRNYTPQMGYFDVQFFKDTTSSSDEVHTDTNIEQYGKFFIAFSVKTSSVVP